MSRTRDLVEFAAGNVRVPVYELTTEERINLFQVVAKKLTRHYSSKRGGAAFLPWEKVTVQGTCLNRLDDTGIKLPKKWYPNEDGYLKDMRVVILARNMFNLPGYNVYTHEQWQKDRKVGYLRICLTQDGKLMLEWYEAQVGNDRFSADVREAEYVPAFSRVDNSVHEKMKLILAKSPRVLDQFMQRTLKLINTEATEREHAAKRDRELYCELRRLGEFFEVTLV